MTNDADMVSLLEALVINNRRLNDLETLVGEFNIFEAIGAVRQELRHSDFLAFLLNPSEKHGLDDRFLKRFLIKVLLEAEDPPLTPIAIDVADLSSASVERESQNIDILIHDVNSGLVCVIENKVYSSEHSNQLARYYSLVRGRFPNATTIIPVFLTPDGIPPDDDDSPYIPVSYGMVADTLDQLRQAQASMLGADVNTMMDHYVTMLRRYIVSDSDIAQLCQEIYQAHKAAIDLIIEHKPDLRKDLADYLADLVRNESSLTLVRDTKSYVDFVPLAWQEIAEFNLGIGWSGSSTNLAFEFANGQDQLILYVVLGPVEEEHQYIREMVFNHAYSNRDLFKGCRPKLSKLWTVLYKMPLLKKNDYVDASLEDLVLIIEPKWQHFLWEIMPQISDRLMGIQFE